MNKIRRRQECILQTKGNEMTGVLMDITVNWWIVFFSSEAWMGTLFFLNIKACQTYLIRLNHVYFFYLTFLYRSLTQKSFSEVSSLTLLPHTFTHSTGSEKISLIWKEIEKKVLDGWHNILCIGRYPFITMETHFSSLRNQTTWRASWYRVFRLKFLDFKWL